MTNLTGWINAVTFVRQPTMCSDCGDEQQRDPGTYVEIRIDQDDAGVRAGHVAILSDDELRQLLAAAWDAGYCDGLHVPTISRDSNPYRHDRADGEV